MYSVPIVTVHQSRTACGLAAFTEFLQQIGRRIEDPGFAAVSVFIGNWDSERTEIAHRALSALGGCL